MTNPNRRYSSQAEDNFDRSIHTRKATPTEVAYRDGYVRGSNTERDFQDQYYAVRENNNAARGLVIGIALASLVGLVAGTIYYLNRDPDVGAPVLNTPVLVPQNTTPQNRETTIIERTRELIPVPQDTAPESQVPAPEVNVTVPEQPAPNVNVNVPEQPAPEVNVNVPAASQSAPAQSPTEQPAATSEATTQENGAEAETTAPATTTSPQ